MYNKNYNIIIFFIHKGIMIPVIQGSGTASSSLPSEEQEQQWGKYQVTPGLTTTPAVSHQYIGTIELPGWRYKGQMRDGRPYGEGECIWSDGMSYKGSFLGIQPHGQGTLTQHDGGCYKGPFLNGKRHGRGTTTLPHGTSFVTEFYAGRMESSLANLKDLAFLQLLAGESVEGLPVCYVMGIVADFLHQNGDAGFADKLQAAMAIYQSPDRAAEAEKIVQNLQAGKSSLLVLESLTHFMGLNIVRDSNSPEYAWMEIFNSGEGLCYHEKHETNEKKFQTMMVVSIPTANITPGVIHQLLGREATTEDVYEMILNLPDAEVIEQDPARAVYQTMQKSGNCSAEWIFAWYRNKRPAARHHLMREQLFLLCISELQKNNEISPEQCALLIAEFQGKVDKRVAWRKGQLPAPVTVQPPASDVAPTDAPA